jgi:NAD(P)-dependent dehydrogenase (short-subunit alcohol dehydrogenase family)
MSNPHRIMWNRAARALPITEQLQAAAIARHWTLELKERRIRVNVLSPRPTKTPGLVGLAGDDHKAQQDLLDQIAPQVPLGRVADPDEIAGAALFLASDDSSFVTGVELFADGGQAQV